ncbi:pupal cuticle protein C1B [Drosophila takahashii]|uniref:pupal cuticle protein C1B n=1 Tax=Drosophila takahashii TaxID=29030 RepID=UPI001CF8AA20|nr:cuticle protein 16.5 [Drosophila takahashii]
MYKFLVLAALIACSAAKPGVVAPLAAPLAYANAPLYAAGGSSQVDVRNNYDGTLSSYTTAPFEFTAPYSSRYVSGIPAAPAVVAKYTAAPVAAAYSAPLAAPAVAAPLAAAPLAAAPYATPYAAAAYSAYPYASPYAAPYLASPYAAPYAAPFAAAAAAPVVV